MTPVCAQGSSPVPGAGQGADRQASTCRGGPEGSWAAGRRTCKGGIQGPGGKCGNGSALQVLGDHESITAPHKGVSGAAGSLPWDACVSCLKAWVPAGLSRLPGAVTLGAAGDPGGTAGSSPALVMVGSEGGNTSAETSSFSLETGQDRKQAVCPREGTSEVVPILLYEHVGHFHNILGENKLNSNVLFLLLLPSQLS